MGRVLTNTVALAYTPEESLNVPGTDWTTLEPNDITTYGAKLTTISRNPISKNRQRLKGLVSDLDSAVEFNADLTVSAFRDFIAGFCFSVGINSDVTQIPSTAAITASDTFAIPALTAGQAGTLAVNTLLWVTGGLYDDNNGLKVVKTSAATGGTTLAVVENLVDETADFRVSFTGFRATSITWVWDPLLQRGSLIDTAIGTNLQSRGLIPGTVIHIGSIEAKGDSIIINGFQNAVANDMIGYARCIDISPDVVIFDKVDAELQFTDSTAPSTPVDILFGEYFRNVPTDDPDFLTQSYQFELGYPNLGIIPTPGPLGDYNQYQYSKGNYCSTVSFEVPLADKAILNFGFIGTDTDNPVDSLGRKAGTDSPNSPTQNNAFNTSSNVIRLRVLEEDEQGITTDFKSLTLTINNNVSPEKVIGVLGTKFLNIGNFEVNIEAQLVFTNPAVINKIRCNERVSMDFILRNEDGSISVDIPAMTMGDGSVNYPVGESVLISTSSQAYIDPNTKTSIGISLFPLPLPTTEVCEG